MFKILVLHGPNLNLLGSREPEIYGHHTLDSINTRLLSIAAAKNIELAAFQSNHEGALIDQIHLAKQQGIQFIIINPAAFTHTSVGIRDALIGVEIPFIEIHLSNTHAREAFRHKSFLSDIATGVIMGLGATGYELALEGALRHLENTQNS